MATLFGKRKKGTKRLRSEDDDLSRVLLVDDNENRTLNVPLRADGHDTTTTQHDDADVAVTRSSVTVRSFDDLGLVEPLVSTCHKMGFRRPTPVQRQLIPFLLHNRREHVLALAATGSGKTAAFVLPILHHLQKDPFGVYAVIVTPTRELAQQIHQQCLALGSAFAVTSVLVVGGLDAVRQSCALQHQPPHFLVATPGRLAALLRGPPPRPRLQHCRYLVLDEADRLLAANNNNNCGFERDVAELLLHINITAASTAAETTASTTTSFQSQRKQPCQTLLFSATLTASLSAMEELAGGGKRLSLRKFIVRQDGEDEEEEKQQQPSASGKKKKSKMETTTSGANDNDDDDENDDDKDHITVGPRIPDSLQQEYVFMPAKVRDAYLLATVRTLMAHGGRSSQDELELQKQQQKQNNRRGRGGNNSKTISTTRTTLDDEAGKARSAIVFVSTCERAAFVSGLLEQVGVANVALHSLLSQPRRLAALAKFQSVQVRVLVATDVAARGLDIPHTDLVINAELPRNPVNYVHRVGRTARAGRRGRAVSLVAETDIELVHAAERASGRELVRCESVTDDMAVSLLGPTTKAARLVKLKLQDIGFDELVQKFKERKMRDRKERQRLDRALRKQEKDAQIKS